MTITLKKNLIFEFESLVSLKGHNSILGNKFIRLVKGIYLMAKLRSKLETQQIFPFSKVCLIESVRAETSIG
ncbi:hypothetical protein BpHYR1_037854 [Brachionus plicatilis]|uniref:Uncharacterized protein n=1 Tax=Brachionus plicatilis TaxID=10195 RepID=A0A3M7RRI0_BRAPC|nr:hypothetical protein BpHYR1_037854 [Brachionus plicatilis]